jgi:hypothetical protein
VGHRARARRVVPRAARGGAPRTPSGEMEVEVLTARPTELG